MTIQEESSDRWEHLEHVAYAIDGEPGSEADMLSKALESFPECTPDADYLYRFRPDRTVVRFGRMSPSL